MNNKYRKFAVTVTSIWMILLPVQIVYAQCNNLTLSLTKTNSTCLANGKIKVTVTGSDASNINQNTMEFQVSGDKDIAFTHYENNTIEHLPAGTYTITLRAFCQVTNDWIIASQTAETTITSSYKELNFAFGRPRPTLSCIPTGLLSITIEAGTGTAPFNIEITNAPASYSGSTSFTTTSRSYEITNLNAGNYTVKITDDCGYEVKDRTVTIESMTQDYDPNLFYTSLVPPNTVVPNECDAVYADRRTYSSTSLPDEYHYFYAKSADYYEVAFLLNDNGTKVWEPLVNTSDIKVTLPPGNTIKSMRENSDFLTPYIRVKGTTCEFKLNNLSVSILYMSVTSTSVGCNALNVTFSPYNSSSGLFCYPYEWRIVRSDNSVFLDWQGPVSDRTSQRATDVPLSSVIEFRDNEGVTWKHQLSSSLPTPSFSSSTSPTFTRGTTDGFFHSYFSFYFYSYFPPGTNFQFNSGPTTPIHTNVTITDSLIYFYPFSANYKTIEYSYLKPGTYLFTVTRPGCNPEPMSLNYGVYKLATPASFTTQEECDGIIVTPTAGKIEFHSYNGSIINYDNLYYRIYTSIPNNLPYNKTTVVEKGGTLKLPQTGKYVIGMSTSSSATSTPAYVDTITYTPTPFTLDNTVTSHYFCQGATDGFIRVKGAGGSGDYMYELYDNGSLIATNNTGVFNYGTAGSTYTVKLHDIQCGFSYPQNVSLVDLGIAQIAYSSEPDNKFCNSDSIYLKCLTLGETTYEWSGPGITSEKKNMQNPAIAASDIGLGTHIFTIRVTPENCGQEMQQTVTITVEDCSGARDDYLILFMNTTDSVDVLANDGYPSSCSASVIPLVTTGPTKGSYIIRNKKIVYTPNTGFIGKDSLTYSTTCEGSTTYAKVYFTVIVMPDNIVDPDCWIEPEKKEWKIQLNQQLETVATTAAFVVGDMNEDGFPDIVAYGISNRSSIKIFWGPDFTSVKEITGVGADSNTTLAIAKVKISDTPSEQYESFIFYRSGSTLRALRADGTSPWSVNPNSRYPGMIGVADFNGDGWSEVYLGNQIYDAATGTLLCDGGTAENSGTTLVVLSNAAQPVAIDILGDSDLELVAGNKIYKVDIDRNTSTPKSLTLLSSVSPPTGCLDDGLTVVADFDNDGKLEVLVRRRNNNTGGSRPIHLYLWTPHTGTNTGTMLANTTDTHTYFGVPFVGDINGDKRVEIVTLGSNGIYQTQKGFRARRYNENSNTFDLLWDMNHMDQSGATGMTLFDFNNDSISEIVYRDESYLRIINASGKSHMTGLDTLQYYVIDSFISYSETFYEYPVVADIYGNQSSAILVTSDIRGPRPSGYAGNARIDIYTSDPSVPWAPARKVWNQYAYNAVNINEDLTIPRNPLNIATVFAGRDSLPGTSDDVRPYNNFLQQQTLINKYGNPIFLAPDAIPDLSSSSTSLSGKSVSITVAIINQGDAAIGTPVYITLYKESIASANILATGSYNGYINPGETGYVAVTIPDITPHLPFIKIIARINDDGSTFPYQPECDMANSELEFINPGLTLAMKKDATLLLSPPVPGNGTYANPVSVLHNENIKYDITAVNANYNTGTIIIKDTLPAFLKYVSNSATHSTNLSTTTTAETPNQDILTWTITGLTSMATQTVSYEASPEEGSCASQPMFINRAWITASDTLRIVTGNNTYHQGAGVGIVTFSAGLGGNIYNSDPQAIDYNSTAKGGVLVVPEEGYIFTGWSHDNYVSLRGQTIPAENGIMYYDTLTIFGNVALTANFKPEEYTIRYRMNESKNPDNNPFAYTIESGTITLKAPEKAGDTFIGWTGSNGDEPQIEVNIPAGSTGERIFFANFLHSGKEDGVVKNDPNEDKIWATKDELHVHTSKTGSIVRIYSTEGTLHTLHTIVSAGNTRIKLRRGIYIVTLNNSVGQKVFIE